MAHNNRMNPTGPIGPRCIGAFACAVGLIAEQVPAWVGPTGYAGAVSTAQLGTLNRSPY